MNAYRKFMLGAVLMPATLLAASASLAQDTAGSDEDIGPAVDTSATDVSRNEEIDALEPAVASPQLRDDISRRTSGNRVMDQIELGRTEITGNQELPKVLYIVPWKKSDPGDLLGRPANTLIDDVLAPIDREEFVRRIDYYDDLYGNEED